MKIRKLATIIALTVAITIALPQSGFCCINGMHDQDDDDGQPVRRGAPPTKGGGTHTGDAKTCYVTVDGVRRAIPCVNDLSKKPAQPTDQIDTGAAREQNPPVQPQTVGIH